MDHKYWRVKLVDKSTVDVEAESVMIDGKNNIVFRIDHEPVVSFHRQEWRAFKQITKLNGVDVWSVEKEATPEVIYREWPLGGQNLD